jgi:hypothetical protein
MQMGKLGSGCIEQPQNTRTTRNLSSSRRSAAKTDAAKERRERKSFDANFTNSHKLKACKAERK